MAVDPHRDAALYDALHCGNEGDIAFYAALCEGASRILELGCGAGRILSALDARAERVGIDVHPGLLALARARLRGTAILVEAEMSRVPFGDDYDRILLPYGSLYCLLDARLQRDVLRRAARALRPGGILALDAYAADDFHHHADPEEVPSWEAVATWPQIEVSERSTWDRPAQRLDVQYRFVHDDGSEHLQALPQRYLLSTELREMIEEAGLRVSRLDADFAETPFDPALSEHWLLVAEKPS